MSSQPVEDAAPVSRVQRKRGRRVQEILSTAAELFGERGYDGVSLDDVAERLDVTKGSLYYYFPGKDELAVAAIETLGADWTGRLERLAATAEGPPHKRGTPPNVVETDAPTWLALVTGTEDWKDAQATGRIRASGLRADLSAYLPMSGI